MADRDTWWDWIKRIHAIMMAMLVSSFLEEILKFYRLKNTIRGDNRVDLGFCKPVALWISVDQAAGAFNQASLRQKDKSLSLALLEGQPECPVYLTLLILMSCEMGTKWLFN